MKKSLLQYRFVLAIPFINAIASNTTEFFPAGVLNPGILRAIIIGLFSVYFILTSYPNNYLSRFIFYYLCFNAFLIFLSADVLYSANLYLKFLLGVIMFPIGYYYINSVERLKTLTLVLFYTLVLHIINLIIANIFNLGSSDYLAESFYFGSGRVNITKSIIILVLMAPVALLFFKKHRVIVALVFIIGFLVAMIGIKRSVLLSGISGFVIYALLREKKTNLIKTAIGFGLLFILIISVYPRTVDLFLERFESRSSRVELSEQTLDSEARYNETLSVFDSWVNGSVKHKLIGTDLFNDRQFFNVERMLHTDYMIILNGSGIIGFILWFYMYWLIIKEKRRFYPYLRKEYLFQELNSVFWVLLSTQMLLSISGTVYAIEVRSLLFLFWGATLGTMRGYILSMANTNEIKAVV